MTGSVCLNCGGGPTIRAHLIPQSFVREVKGRDTDHAFVQSDGQKYTSSKNGLFDDYLLCAECDGRLGAHENYVLGLLSGLRGKTTALKTNHLFEAHVDGNRFLRFATGIAWKYASTARERGRIEVGPYANLLRDISLNRAVIPSSVDAFVCRLHSGDGEVYIYRAPKLDKQLGVNFVRFSVGGFVIFLKLDKRPNPQAQPASNWVRGASSFSFPVLPMTAFEEGRFALTARRQNPKLDAFLNRVSR
tara:strand:+ start:5485 stop:6225 length:741 start_codon:yes stop_codon:yes gene_type:complete